MKLKLKKEKEKVRIPSSQKEFVVKRKRTEEDEEEAPVKKKKKKKLSEKKIGTALAIIDGANLPKVKKKDLTSYFGKHTPVILEMIEMNDNDGGLTLLQKKLLQTTVSLVPYAEKMVRNTESQRGIYQYTALVNQVREIITDIKANEDRRYIAQALIESVIRPAFMEIAQHIITDHHEFRKTTERFVKPEHTQTVSAALQALAKELAQKMMLVYKDVEAKTQDQLKS
jgi:hypothetical protein